MVFVSAYFPQPLILSIHRSDRTGPGEKSRSHTSPTTNVLCVLFDRMQKNPQK